VHPVAETHIALRDGSTMHLRRSTIDVPELAATIAAVEGDVELAVIAVPTSAVVDTARSCAAKGVRALVVLSV
jgi:hypothetical protein